MTAGPGRPRYRGLTPAEIKVVEGVSRGMTNAEIAAALFLEPNTIKTQLFTASRKLGARNRAHVVLQAMRSGQWWPGEMERTAAADRRAHDSQARRREIAERERDEYRRRYHRALEEIRNLKGEG